MGTRRSVAETGLRITFRGPGLEDHTINARDLGRTLVSLSDAFTTTYGLVGDKSLPTPSLTIRDTGAGSFWVDLNLIVDSTAIQVAVDVLTGKYVEAALTLDAIVAAAVGAILFIKKRRGRKIKAVEEFPTAESVRIQYQDGTQEEVPASVWLVAKSAEFQRAAREAMKAVTTRGIDKVEIETDMEGLPPVIEVTDEDYPHFQVDEAEAENVAVSTFEIFLVPMAVTFKQGNKWRFDDGERVISAVIEDESFLADLDENRIRIGKNDQFKVLLRAEQRTESGKLRTDYTVVRVLSQISPGVQEEFHYEETPAEAVPEGAKTVPPEEDEPPEPALAYT